VELQSKFAFGEGKSRRAAEQNAAMRVLKQFNYSDKDAISQDDKMTDGRKAL
jgi:dsRNA-specific ribonuclease